MIEEECGFRLALVCDFRGNLIACPGMSQERRSARKTNMFRLSAVCLVILLTAPLVAGDAAAQYGGGQGGGYYSGGGYHAEGAPRRSQRREGQQSGGPQSGGKQCYTKRTKVGDRWEQQTVCE